MNRYSADLVEYVEKMNADAVVVAQEGSIDMPEGYRLVSTSYIHGKRVREFERIDDGSREQGS